MDELKRDEATFKLLKVIEEINTAIKMLSNKLEGYYIRTRFLLDKINSNLIENQVPGVDGNFDYYVHKNNKIDRIIDLLESNLNQCFNK